MERTRRQPSARAREEALRALPSFRPDVQGLRALAVLLVVAGHVLGVPSGGYVGVDVFFVVSGFLITGLLLREHGRTGRVDLREFYARRARRLLPAGVLALAVTNVVALLLFRGERALQTVTDAVWALGFLANVRFAALGTDYFDAERPPSPVQHYWSLAVEEQYYVVWPCLLLGLLLLLRRRQGALLAVVLALVAASFAWSVGSTAADPTGAYFSTAARAWELGVGAALAVALHLGALPRLPARLGTALTGLGVAGIAAAAFAFDPRTAFPGTAAALPVLATALVLLGGTTGAPNRLLVNPASEYVGRLSYSLYLWHWPVLVVAVAVLPAVPERTVAVLSASFALAMMSHHLVEEPVRRSAWLSRRPSGGTRTTRARTARRSTRAAVSLTAVAALLVGGWVLPAVALRDDGAPPAPAAVAAAADGRRLAAELAASVSPASWPPLEVPLDGISRAGAPEWLVDKCDNVNAGNVERCRYGDPAAPRTAALVGDSMAISWLPALREVLEPRGWQIQVLTRNQCALPEVVFFRDRPDVPYTQCADHKDWVVEQVQALRPDLVVASNSITSLDHQLGEPQGDARFASWQAGMTATLQRLAAAADRVVLLGPPPRSGNLQSCVTRISSPADCTDPVSADWRGLRTAEQAAAAAAGADYVDVEPLFCSAGLCPAVVGATPVYTDGRHLTEAYARRVAPRLGALLDAAHTRVAPA